MPTIQTGHCSCGAVRFKTRGVLRGVIYCHCSQCRRQTGHFLASTAAEDTELEIEGADRISWFQSSPEAKRGFCAICGSGLFWKNVTKSYTSILAGAFGFGDRVVERLFDGGLLLPASDFRRLRPSQLAVLQGFFLRPDREDPKTMTGRQKGVFEIGPLKLRSLPMDVICNSVLARYFVGPCVILKFVPVVASGGGF